MDGTLAILLGSLFLGAFVSGLAGFAMGIIVLSAWLHFVPLQQCAILIVAFGFITQGYGVWKLRHAFRWKRVAPFVLGGAAGVPLGTLVLAHSDPGHLKLGVGILVIAYSLYGLLRPPVRIERGGLPADVAMGATNGFLAGLTGLVGIVITIWCQLRGWPKDEQRTVFQPVMLMVGAMSGVALAMAGAINSQATKLFLLGAPVAFAGTWLGLRLYGRVSEAGFRRVVLAMLLLSGLSLALNLSGAR